MYTELPEKRQDLAIDFIPGEGEEVQEAVLEIPENGIAHKNGADVIIIYLNRLYKKDSTVIKYQALETFETFRRPCDMSIQSLKRMIKKFEKNSSIKKSITNNSKKVCTKPSHMVLKCLKTSLLMDY